MHVRPSRISRMSRCAPRGFDLDPLLSAATDCDLLLDRLGGTTEGDLVGGDLCKFTPAGGAGGAGGSFDCGGPGLNDCGGPGLTFNPDGPA